MAQPQDRLSLFNMFFPVTVLVPEAANPDTSLDVVQFQFVLGGLPPKQRPVDDEWVNGFWTTTEQGALLAGILIGPGGSITPSPGKWAIWMQIFDSPSKPVAPVDQITIT